MKILLKILETFQLTKILVTIVGTTKILRYILFSSTFLTFGYFIYECMTKYSTLVAYFTKNENLSIIIITLVLIFCLLIFIILPKIGNKIIKIIPLNIITESVIKIISNLIWSFIMANTALFSRSFLKNDPNVMGEVFKNEYLTITKNFTLIEKQEWLMQIHRNQLKDLPDKFWIKISDNIPWESITSKQDLLEHLLKGLTAIKSELSVIITNNAIRWYHPLLEFPIEHPYLFTGIIITTTFVLWYYWKPISDFVVEMGEIQVEKLKVMQDHMKANHLLAESQEVLANHVHEIHNKLPYLASKDEMATIATTIQEQLLKHKDYISELTHNLASVAAKNPEIMQQVIQQGKDIKKLAETIARIVEKFGPDSLL